ncbi:helix-turn-helix domain-containing protein [Streptomyces sp. PSKA54]|uniref:Glycerol operon regulatory protein n=1 Tax=Streptomyces himalayensis subsp. aureolus TaxID=2758039 RepID=A0A7W2D1C6_9ACTN|nr:helix-turn-helix domain-containing protein [Streptomyces himalayensis subsp. aureolus]
MAKVDTTPADKPPHGLPAPPGLAPGGARAQAPTLISSVQRAIRLLEAVAAHDHGAPAKQLARETGLALPTAYHLLRTLAHEGYLHREDGLFVLGEATERLGSKGAQQKRRGIMGDALAHWRDSLGVPVYYAVYQEGEIDVLAVVDSPAAPAVPEWADFRETAHTHAIGQCLLSQLDDEARRDHLDRYPVQSITAYSVRDERTFLRRLQAIRRMQPVIERQEYALGTVCAAIPLTFGTTAAAIAVSLPAHQEERLMPVARRLQSEIGRLSGTLGLYQHLKNHSL